MHFKLIVAFVDSAKTDKILSAAREHGATGTIRLIHSGARTREMSGGVESAGARHQYVGAGNAPLPANALYAGRRAFEGAGFGH